MRRSFCPLTIGHRCHVLGETHHAATSLAEPNHFFQKLKPGYIPGDLGFDPLGLKPEDPAEFREMQTKELQNGRLAMIAAAGFLAQEAVSDTTWGTYWGAADF